MHPPWQHDQRRKQIKMIYTPLHFVPLIFTLLLATILLLLLRKKVTRGFKNESENLINFIHVLVLDEGKHDFTFSISRHRLRRVVIILLSMTLRK